MRTLFINNIPVGTIKIVGGADNGLEGKFTPNVDFDKYKELFRLVTSDFEHEENYLMKQKKK